MRTRGATHAGKHGAIYEVLPPPCGHAERPTKSYPCGYDQSNPRSPTHADTIKATHGSPTHAYPRSPTHSQLTDTIKATHGVLPIRNSQTHRIVPRKSYPFATRGHTEATHGVLPNPTHATTPKQPNPCDHTEATRGHTEATRGYDQSDPTHVCPRKRLICSQKITHSHSHISVRTRHAQQHQTIQTHVTWSY